MFFLVLNLPSHLPFFLATGSEGNSSYSSAMTEAAVPETVVSPAAGGLHVEKAGGPVMDFSYVGIDAILEQMRRKAMKQGFELNIMVVGKLVVHVVTSMFVFVSGLSPIINVCVCVSSNMLSQPLSNKSCYSGFLCNPILTVNKSLKPALISSHTQQDLGHSFSLSHFITVITHLYNKS